MVVHDLQTHIVQNMADATEMVDLLRLSQTKARKHDGSLKLVVDGECCLDRLYGGYYPDWVCGGQWNKMEQFLRNFCGVVHGSNLDLVIFFNGTLESDRITSEWGKKQEETYRFLEEIYKHVSVKKKPPPKIWWVPPAFLRSAARLAFRSLHMKIMCTLDDHHKDVVRFCQRNNFEGIVADDPEYLLFDTQRYFSAQKLKLTFKGSLETVEVKLKKVFDNLSLPKGKFLIFAALLGNHILTEKDLHDFFVSLQIDQQSKTSVIEKVAEFTRTLEPTDPEKIGELIAKSGLKTDEDKANIKMLTDKVVKCLRYYADSNVTKTNTNPKAEGKSKSKAKKAKAQAQNQNNSQNTATTTPQDQGDVAAAASANATLPSDADALEKDGSKIFSETNHETEPAAVTPITNGAAASFNSTPKPSSLDKLLYRLNKEIDTVATTRHKSGLMSPYICQIFKHKEIKLPVIIEDIKGDLPRAHDIFRPLRQRVYAVLFNLHHLHFLAKQKNEKVPTLHVKETVYCPKTKTCKTQSVEAVEIGWGVPTVERLWLGEEEDCKRKRIRAFLTILKSDKAVILDSTCVPQQMLVLTCVLRYLLSSESKIFRKNELDAFIAQAFIQDMTDPNIAQDIEMTNLTMRGVHLSHMFMEGVEMALLANDACGAPIPYMLFCPWLFFNGKIFNYILEQQSIGKSLAEICGYKMDLVYNIDQLRTAVGEGIKIQFVQPPQTLNASFLLSHSATPLMNQVIAPPRTAYLPSQYNQHGHGLSASLSQLAAAAAAASHPSNRARIPLHLANSSAYGGQTTGLLNSDPFASLYGNSGYYSGVPSVQNRATVPLLADIPGRQRRVQPRGGHLEIAGQIVGSWGANYGPNGNLSHLGLSSNVGRNARLPLGVANVHQQAHMASLFDQMRISGGGNKVPNRGGSQTSNNWHHKKNAGKSQKKSIMKKPGETSGKGNHNASGGVGNSSASKAKGVSFKEPSAATEKVVDQAENTNSVASLKGEMNESSPEGKTANSNENHVKVEG